jgi:predicted tellurium resistance membrane protein TerC
MLVCFGISWPISIVKALQTKRVVGKSPVFMAIVCLGYLSGILHKVLFAFDWVILLYFVNLFMVAFDLVLYFYYLPQESNRGEYAAIPDCR